MPLVPDPYSQQVVSRLLEFATPATPWHRRLWRSGPLQTAAELLDAGATRGTAGTAMRELQADLVAGVKDDPGLGRHSGAIRAALPKDARDLTAGRHAWHALSAATGAARSGYLLRFADTLDAPHSVPAETAARRIATHLFDSGWSATHAHRWMSYRVRHRADPVALPDLLREAQADLCVSPRRFAFLAPLARAPHLPLPAPAGWLTGKQAAAWRAANVPGSRPVRLLGAVLVEVDARDVYSAADAARGRLEALSVRFSVGGRKHVAFTADLWVAGRPDPLPTAGSPRRVEVRAFQRLDRLFDPDIPQQLVGALALLAPLDRGAAPAAVIGAWSAVESLLVGPSDGANSVAAGRLALIVAASHLRAELTVLAWSHARTAGDVLAADIAAAPTNAGKARLAQRAIAAGTPLVADRDTDAWALERLRPLLADPRAGVMAVQHVLNRTFLRLYRQRNSIAHGGRTEGEGLASALRLAAPLVGAGVDRVAQALLDGGSAPLALAAAARTRLETLAPATAADAGGLVSLLDG